MIEETALVIRSGPGYAEVRPGKRSACGSCSAKGGCGTALVAGLLGRRRNNTLRLADPLGTRPGERVVLGIDEAAMVRASLLLYGLPLVTLLAGMIAGQSLAGEAGAFVGGGSAFAATLLGLRLRGVGRFARPVILRRDPAASVFAPTVSIL